MTMLKVVEILAQSEKMGGRRAARGSGGCQDGAQHQIGLYPGDGGDGRERSDHLLPGQRQDFLRDRRTIIPRRIGIVRTPPPCNRRTHPVALSTRVRQAVVLEEERDE